MVTGSKPKNSLRSRLTISCVIVVVISFAFLAFFLSKNLEERSLNHAASLLAAQGQLITAYIIPGNLSGEGSLYPDSFLRSLSKQIKCRLTLVNAKGKVLVDSDEPQEKVSQMENHLNRPEIKAALAGSIGKAVRASSTLGKDMLYIALPLRDQGKVSGVLRLSLPLEIARQDWFAARNSFIRGLIFALAFAFVLGSVLAGAIVKPIKKMVKVSHQFAQGDFSQRLPWYSPDELGELAVTLNAMAQEIEDKIRKIQLQGQQLEAVFNSMVEGVIVTDKSSRVISLNPAVEKIFGTTVKEAQGKLFLEAIRNNEISETINNALKSGEFICRELHLAWPVAGIFEISASPVFDKIGVSGCLLVLHDITGIRKLETIRRDFVANVSHELKTPLTSIKGFVETLLEGALEDKHNARQFLEIIRDHTNRLNSLINDLLELSHIESREIELEIEQVQLKDLVDKIVSGFATQLKKRSLVFYNELPAGLIVRADNEKIEQVFTNLIDNAIKFNKENGFVRVSSKPHDGQVKIVVEDSGAGIPSKDLPRIFERFYRVDKARSRELGGTGLGLSIVKHIVELHSGKAGVESTEGIGSTFWFTLPR
jgi:two-component system, OmpR family, phosphate regulon sensor histidine kinase PhoR